MIPIARPNVGEEERAAILEVLDSGMYAQGARVKEFEERFAAYVGRRHGIAVCNGTAALHVALLAHGIGKGDEVIVPPLTFMASAATVVLCGARPRFADIEEDTYTLDPARAAKAVGKRTKAIMPVHLFGQAATMQPLVELAREKGVAVIEDACQAHGAQYQGKKAGALGDTACFSFYPTKNMTTGEGGMIVTDDDAVAAKCRLLRDQGQSAKYVHDVVGFNLRMTEFAAALGMVQLRKLSGFLEARRRNAQALTEALAGKTLVAPVERPDRVHSFYQFMVRVGKRARKSRDEYVRHFTERGVGCRPGYPMPLYRQKALVDLGIRGRCGVAERVIPRLFELPVHPLVSEADLDVIRKAIAEA
ncbi:MAG TPA: DegT/DnrJ/EryC1/StrS family aminotransferase [Thermoplasmata archaeon]|nr:DegT/DnrJ/EryC1/StrS family aminotransferase [Thermoplasmata archaeon]